MVELARSWLRYQPESALSKWFSERFAGGGKRMRCIGIVALARRSSDGGQSFREIVRQRDVAKKPPAGGLSDPTLG